MVKRLFHWIATWSFRTQLGAILIVVTMIPTLTFYAQVMELYEQDMVASSIQNTTAVLKTNNRLLDTTLKRIEDASYSMINNQSYYDIFSNSDGTINNQTYDNSSLVRLGLSQQFLYITEIEDRFLYTDSWIYGQIGTEMKATISELQNSPLVSAARDANGQAVWLTGYRYADYFQSQFLEGRTGYRYEYPITMVRQMNFQYTKKNVVHSMDEDVERPILVVQICEESIRTLYENTIEHDEVLYGITNKDGVVISSNNELIPISTNIETLVETGLGNSGNKTITFDGESYLLCYDTILNRGWTSFTLIPMMVYTQNAMQHLKVFQVAWLVGLLCCAVLIAVLLSRVITRPIESLIQSTKRVAGGDFSANTTIPKGKDFKQLAENFNEMEVQINRLIQENYDISLRERDTQIMALTMQINPHFLHNTLNTINMLAMEHDDEETADLILSLSEIISFTFRNRDEKITLTDEVYWVENYINIMQKRVEGSFAVQIDVPDELYDCMVPKFILQPLVENAILHGFQDLDGEGKVIITATQVENTIEICVADNGIGMEEAELEAYRNQKSGSLGIGMLNVYQRLALIYGNEFYSEIQSAKDLGTKITLRFPMK